MDANVSVLTFPLSNQNSNSSSVWGDFFLQYDSNRTEIGSKDKHEHERLKEEVIRKMLVATPPKSLQKLELIDAIQRLGVFYHFENEINTSLEYVYNVCNECFEQDGSDIHAVALRFRLLRQQGYLVTCDVFNKFHHAMENFDEAQWSNTKRVLSLYEAAHLSVDGEDILDEALDFTTILLESTKLSNLSNSLAAQVVQALKFPIRMTMQRLGAREYIPIYEDDESHNTTLLKFAKLDFNILQKMHQKELYLLTKWWNDLKAGKNLYFARQRLVESYYWSLGVHCEPQYWFARTINAKISTIMTIIDDIYDEHGTLNELELFTTAIERWDISASRPLPLYMRHCYLAVLDLYSEIEGELAKFGKTHLINYGKEAFKEYIGAYFQEAKWQHQKHNTKFEEYMKVAIVSVGMKVCATTAFLCMTDTLTEDIIKWVSRMPPAIRAASEFCRLMDDIYDLDKIDEKAEGYVKCAVYSYMREYGTNKEEALAELRMRTRNAWKDINKECLYNVENVPMSFLVRALTIYQTINLIYAENDNAFKHPKVRLDKVVLPVLVNPVV